MMVDTYLPPILVDACLPIVVSLAVASATPTSTYNNSADAECICDVQNSSAVALDAQVCVERNMNLDKLNNIGKLKPGWNGYGAPSIEEGIINQAKLIVAQLKMQPEIFPTGRGTVQMEYHQNDGTYLEFELFTDKITVLYIGKGDIENAKEDVLSLTDYAGMLGYIGYLS